MTLDVDFLTSTGDLVSTTPVELEHNLDHAGEAIGNLIQYFRDGPRNQALLTAVMSQIQEIEDAAWYIRNAFDPNTAVGEQLDFVGRWVNEHRAVGVRGPRR